MLLYSKWGIGMGPSFLLLFLVSGRGVGMDMSHLLFANNTLILHDTNKEHREHLSWAFIWFKAILGLKINLEKSELI